MLERKGRHFLLFLSPALLHIFYPACVHGRDSLVIVYLKGRNPRIVSSCLRVFPPFFTLLLLGLWLYVLPNLFLRLFLSEERIWARGRKQLIFSVNILHLNSISLNDGLEF